MLHEPTIYPGVERIKDEAKIYDPELYQVAQNLHLLSDEEVATFIESRWGGLKKLAKKGFSAAKNYVNKNKGAWMKKAAGVAKGWYNKQGKKVLGKMLKKAGDWAKSKGIPAGLVDKAQAMAAKGADRAVAAGAKRVGAEELPVVVGRNREDGWDENREEWGVAGDAISGLTKVAGGVLVSGVKSLTGELKAQVDSLSKTLTTGVKAVKDITACAANPFACAKKHCPAVALAVAKALTNALKGQVIAQATALCGAIAGQFGLLFAPIPPPGVIAGVATTAVAAYCIKEATTLINKAFNMATQMAADTLCGVIFGKKELELLVQKMAGEHERQLALYQISQMP